MDISAVRLLTDHRTKVLSETGAEWYHPENAFWSLAKTAGFSSGLRSLPYHYAEQV
jgi:G:T/U-mismatch repair DNA glycosylase